MRSGIEILSIYTKLARKYLQCYLCLILLWCTSAKAWKRRRAARRNRRMLKAWVRLNMVLLLLIGCFVAYPQLLCFFWYYRARAMIKKNYFSFFSLCTQNGQLTKYKEIHIKFDKKSVGLESLTAP